MCAQALLHRAQARATVEPQHAHYWRGHRRMRED
jgi:hypothetical protein